MTLLNTFDPKTTEETFKRLEKLTYMSKPQWGKMNAAQMLAHLNVAYDLAYGRKTSNPNFFTKLMLKLFVKGIVVGEKPYSKNSPTGPDFLISDERDFEKEKAKFIDNVKQTEAHGTTYFEGKESASFGKLTAKQWSIQFYKHLDHHFTQFGV
ncbi:MAG: DUF1569 domain-containing protein [Bacteroidetes bacterium]|nr:DUF1569 domain-containing protein [Bacteroidota bacterium]